MGDTPNITFFLSLHLQSEFLLVWFSVTYFLSITPFINNTILMAKKNSTEKKLSRIVKRQVKIV